MAGCYPRAAGMERAAYTRRMATTVRRLALGAAATVLIAIAALVAVDAIRPSAGPTAVVGDISDFPPGSVTAVPFSVSINADLAGNATGVTLAPVDAERRMSRTDRSLVFVVHQPGDRLLALWARDPHKGCAVSAIPLMDRPIEMPLEPGAVFVNPCHGEQYALDGSWLRGPAERGLDRFGITTLPDGDVVIDATRYELGPAR